jgi:hypothetical protein
MAKTYAAVIGWVLLITAIVDTVAEKLMHMQYLMGLELHMSHSAVHLVSGIAGIWAATVAGGKNARAYALIFGAIYLLVAAIGFAGSHGDFGAYVHFGLGTGYNVIHAAVGVLGIAAGLATKADAGRAAGAST